MSVYNAEPYLREAVESALSQTFGDFEFVIINDASRDSSREILNKYAAEDPRIKIIDNERNIGLTKSLNKGIAVAKGEYIARMDADDISLPTRLEEEVDFLDKNQNFALVGSWADIIDANNTITRSVEYPIEDGAIKKALIKYNPFFHSSIAVRKQVLDAVGGYDERWRYAQDYELILRISRSYKVANIAKKLIQYREIQESITGSKNRAQIGYVLRAKWKVLKSGQYPFYKAIYLIPTIITWMLPVLVKRYIKNMVRK